MTAEGTDPGHVEQHAAASDSATVFQAGRDQVLVAGDYVVAPGPAPRALASLPPVTAELTGREEELARLLALLDPAAGSAAGPASGPAGGSAGGSAGGPADGPADGPAGGSAGGSAGAVVVSAVAGLAGVGKTTLTVHAAHQAVERGWFPGGHLFLDLRGYEPTGQVTAAQALGALLRALCGADAELPTDPAEQAGLYRSQMAALARERGPALLVLDSASTAAQVEPLLPGGRGHRVVVTSRHTLASLPATVIDLAVLAPADAAAMITRALGGGDPRPAREPRALAELAAYCGFLPLALQIAAANLRADPHRSLAGFASVLKDERARLALSYSDEGQTLAVRAAFELSYRRLPPEQARLFRLLSLNPTPQFTLDAATFLDRTTPEQARRTTVKLAQAHLVEPVAERRWRMHDLVRLYAAELVAEQDERSGQDERSERDGHGEREGRSERDGYSEREGSLLLLLVYYTLTAEVADHHVRALPGQPVTDHFADRADALAWLETERANLVGAVVLTATTRPAAALALTESLAEFLIRRRHFHDAVTTGRHALAAARRLGDRAAEGKVLTFLGSALREVQRFEEAVDVHTQAVDVFRETGDRNGEAGALDNLGLALTELRRFEGAVAAHTRAAVMFRDVGDAHNESLAQGRLHTALKAAQDVNHPDAVRPFWRAVTYRDRPAHDL
ncbi:tetratricopeptide repeat protein [Actinacidiphila yeochonensis]|uniref:tetratricopeptide repeat protein n=1 Tax=Actinacidiphila yeochonensis TaxID=89050 RepID=UPI000691B02B|nr:tetratricopeptide repeat protein [Actinacidiphila yeochonensis]